MEKNKIDIPKKNAGKKWYAPTKRDISDFVIAAGVSIGIEFFPHMESFGFTERATLSGGIATMYGIGMSQGFGMKKGARSGVAALSGAAFGTTIAYVLRQYTDVI